MKAAWPWKQESVRVNQFVRLAVGNDLTAARVLHNGGSGSSYRRPLDRKCLAF